MIRERWYTADSVYISGRHAWHLYERLDMSKQEAPEDIWSWIRVLRMMYNSWEFLSSHTLHCLLTAMRPYMDGTRTEYSKAFYIFLFCEFQLAPKLLSLIAPLYVIGAENLRLMTLFNVAKQWDWHEIRLIRTLYTTEYIFRHATYCLLLPLSNVFNTHV